MDLDDISEVISLFERNVNKLKANLNAYRVEVNTVRQTLEEKLSHVDLIADGPVISAYDGLLSSVSKVNEFVIKLNLHININRPKTLDGNKNTKTINKSYLDESRKNSLNESEIDEHLQKNPFRHKSGPIPGSDTPSKQTNSETPQDSANTDTSAQAWPVFPLPPKGGKPKTNNEAYDELDKKINGYKEGTVVEATIMHVNEAENCIFVSKWDEEMKPLEKMLSCEMPVLEQLPDFGEIFAIYKAKDNIIARIMINGLAQDGGYNAYLIDYGEQVQFDGEDSFFSIPDDVKAVPASAIRCNVQSTEVSSLHQFIYKKLQLRVLSNSGNDLVVELVNEGTSGARTGTPTTEDIDSTLDPTEEAKVTNDSVEEVEQPTPKLSPEELQMLSSIEPSTRSALRALLGYEPKDDKRLCRHYDPKINGCFKGSRCRLLHEPQAAHGATKDVELVEALPESIYVFNAPKNSDGPLRVLVTHVSHPTQLYVQFVDDNPPLVWRKTEVAESQIDFKRAPRELDIVLALYGDDCYYRAQIIEVQDDLYKVFYVDYGNTDLVFISSLAQCSDAISLLPHRANHCCIHGVQLCTTSTSKQETECVKFLESKVLNQELDAVLLGRTPDSYAIKFLGQHADLPKMMIKLGYVEPLMDRALPSESL